jgi:hypothetical protein
MGFAGLWDGGSFWGLGAFDHVVWWPLQQTADSSTSLRFGRNDVAKILSEWRGENSFRVSGEISFRLSGENPFG